MTTDYQKKREDFEYLYKREATCIQEFPHIYFKRDDNDVYLDEMVEAAYKCWIHGIEWGWVQGYTSKGSGK